MVCKMKKKTSKKRVVTSKMTFSSVLRKYPETAEIFMGEGMYCVGCPMAANETIEEGCKAHGMNPDEIVEKINRKIMKIKRK